MENVMAKAKPKKADPGTKGRILVVEDEQDIQDLLNYNLTREGFEVATTSLGRQAIVMIQDRPPDLVLLDLMLPDTDGLEVCRTVKSDPALAQIPIVMLTAKGEEADIVVGLEMGADDYITKPFIPRVLSARLYAVMRRPRPDQETPEGQQAPIKLEKLHIIPERHEVFVHGKPVSLTATEFKLLYQLAKRPGRVFTRQQIIDSLHDGFAAVTDRSVDVQVVSIRRKLGEAGQDIQTVRGVGYRLRG